MKKRNKESSAAPPNNFLHEAVRANRIGVVADLLSKDSTKTLVNACDHFGNTPLHLAASVSNKGSSKDLVELLLQHGANPSTTDKSSWTPLHR